ncbi:hypothetical protein Tco_0674116 [Tanacetum coccineum]
MDNMNEVFDAKFTIRGNLHILTSIKKLLGQTMKGVEQGFVRVRPCLVQDCPFCDRVFPDKIAEPLKKVRVSEVLEVIRSPERWSALSDEDNVKVCLLLVSNIFMGREFKNYIADDLTELV